MHGVVDPVTADVRDNADWTEPFEAYLDADTPEDLSGVVIKAAVQRLVAPGEAQPAAVEFGTPNLTVLITDAEAGRFRMNVQRGPDGRLPLPVGVYAFEIRFFRPGGSEQDFYVGKRNVVRGIGA